MATEGIQDVSFEIIAQTKRSETNVIKLRNAVEQLGNEVAQGNRTAAQADEIYARYAKMLGVTAQEANKTKAAVNQMSQASGRAVRSGGGMNFFIHQVGFLASDAKYGLLGMANNLSLMVSLLPQVAAEAKAAGTTFAKSFVRSLIGPGGLIIAIQLLLSFSDDIFKFFKNLLTGTKEASKATKDLTKSYDDLVAKINEAHGEGGAAEKAIKRLQRLASLFRRGKISAEQFEFAVSRQMGPLRALGLEFDNNYEGVKKFLQELHKFGDISTSQGIQNAINALAKDIINMRTELDVDKILGNLDPVQIAEKELEIFVKTQEALNVSERTYINSPEYRKLQAKITRAKNDVALEEEKKQTDFLNKFIQPDTETRRANALRQARSLGYDEATLATLEEAINKHFDEIVKKEKEQADRLDILKLKQEKERFQALRDIQSIEGLTIEHQRENEISKLKTHLDNKRITEEEYLKALEAVKRKYAILEIKRVGQQFQQLFQLTGKFKGLAIAGVAIDKGAALFDVVKGTQARIKHIKNLPDPTGISQGILIAKAVAQGVIEAGVITAQATQSINQIKQAGGANTGSATDSSRPPNFNIIGATGTNQLQQTLDAQTQSQQDQRVVLVESELDMRMNDKRTTIEQTSLG